MNSTASEHERAELLPVWSSFHRDQSEFLSSRLLLSDSASSYQRIQNFNALDHTQLTDSVETHNMSFQRRFFHAINCTGTDNQTCNNHEKICIKKFFKLTRRQNDPSYEKDMQKPPGGPS